MTKDATSLELTKLLHEQLNRSYALTDSTGCPLYSTKERN
jgi:hypothetical protein